MFRYTNSIFQADRGTLILRHYLSVRSSYTNRLSGGDALQIDCAMCRHGESSTPMMPRPKSRWHAKAYQPANVPNPRCTFSSTTASYLSIIMLHHSVCASNRARISKLWHCRKKLSFHGTVFRPQPTLTVAPEFPGTACFAKVGEQP